MENPKALMFICLEMSYVLVIFVMNFVCVLVWARAVSISIGFTFQPLALISFMRFLYFFVFS
jgi:hypothetical protein